MRAILERDAPPRLRERAFFRLRGLIALGGALGLATAVTGLRHQPPDVIGAAAFGASTRLVLLLVLLVLPAHFAPVLARERAAGALGVLLTTPLSATSLVFGWWLSRLSYVVLLLVPGLPFIVLPLVLGGTSPAGLAAALSVVLTTVLWVSATSLLVGASSSSPFNAMRAAYALVAIVLLVLPRLERGAYLWLANPFLVLEHLSAGTLLPSRLALHLALAGVVAGGALLACIRVLRREGERASAGRPASALARVAARAYAPLCERRPVLWLGCSRGTAFLFRWPSLVALVAVLVAEGSFAIELSAIYEGVGEPLLRGPDGALAAAPLHQRYVASYLALAVLTGILAAATSFHRESATNTLDVFFSTPLPTERIVQGLVLAAVTSAIPFLLLALAHAALAVAGASLSPIGGLSILVTAPVGTAYVCTRAFHTGLRQRTPLRSTLTGLLALLHPPTLTRRTTVLPGLFATVFVLAVVTGGLVFGLLYLFFPVAYLFVPLRDASALQFLALLVMTVFYARTVRDLVRGDIPQQLLVKRDQKYVPLAWYRPEGSGDATAPPRRRSWKTRRRLRRAGRSGRVV